MSTKNQTPAADVQTVYVTTSNPARELRAALTAHPAHKALVSSLEGYSVTPVVTGAGVSFPLDRGELIGLCEAAGFKSGTAVKDDDHGWLCRLVLPVGTTVQGGGIVAQVTKSSGVRFLQVEECVRTVEGDDSDTVTPAKASTASASVEPLIL